MHAWTSYSYGNIANSLIFTYAHDYKFGYKSGKLENEFGLTYAGHIFHYHRVVSLSKYLPTTDFSESVYQLTY